ncbi:MAG: DUF3108 domain-containing protein [Nitrospinota bacterium]
MKTRGILKAAALSVLLLAGVAGVALAQNELVSGVPYEGFLKGTRVQTNGPPVVEEVLVYDISFLFFRNAAVGTLTMKYLPERGLYEGVVKAQTRGFIGFFSLYRQDEYRSLMRLSPNGRLIPVEFHRQVTMGGSRSSSATYLDYERGIMLFRSTEGYGDEAEVETKTHRIPAGFVYEDFISAFFNLRRGIYGPIQPGREVRVLSLPTRKWFKEHQKKPQYFDVKVGERTVNEDGVSRILVSITVPKELFGQKVGAIQFQIREDHVPSRIFVKDAIFFGDMRGSLRSQRPLRKELAAGPSPPAAAPKRSPGSTSAEAERPPTSLSAAAPKRPPTSTPAEPERPSASPPGVFGIPGFSRSFR